MTDVDNPTDEAIKAVLMTLRMSASARISRMTEALKRSDVVIRLIKSPNPPTHFYMLKSRSGPACRAIHYEQP
jgi:hypothetical protein